MTPKDKKLKLRLDAYIENQYLRYMSWYTENARLAKNNLIAAFVVVIICTLAFVFFPTPMDEMSFFQYRFDPTIAIKIGLIASIVLSFVSMYSTFNKKTFCLAIKAQLEEEFSVFQGHDDTGAEVIDEAAFKAFKSAVDRIMAASNPEVVIAVERDNAQKEKSSKV